MHHPQYLCPQPFTLCSSLLRVLQVLVRFSLPRCWLSAFHLHFGFWISLSDTGQQSQVLRCLSFCIFSLLYFIFHHLSLYPAMQLDILAVVVDVVAGVVDVEGNVLVLQVLLQPTLV